MIKAFFGFSLVLLIGIITSSCGDESNGPSPVPEEESPVFAEASFCGYQDFFSISVALDGTTIPPNWYSNFILSWYKQNGAWSHPDTLRAAGGSYLSIAFPCISPDGKYLYGRSGMTHPYHIDEYAFDAGEWHFIRNITPEFNLPNISNLEGPYSPFVTFDFSYIYFGVYYSDGVIPSGIYRAIID